MEDTVGTTLHDHIVVDNATGASVLKKKKKNDNDDDDDDEEEETNLSAVIRAKKLQKQDKKRGKRGKKRQINVIRSFAVSDDEQDNDNEQNDDHDNDDIGNDNDKRSKKKKSKKDRKEEKKKKTRKKRKHAGMGFGGGDAAMDSDDNDGDNDNNDTTAKEASLYGGDALAQLRAQQKVRPKKTNDAMDTSNGLSSSDQQYGAQSNRPNDTDTAPTILTGEQAMDVDGNNVGTSSDVPMGSSKLSRNRPLDRTRELGDDTPEASAWEAEISRRAGLAMDDTISNNNSNNNTDTLLNNKSVSELRDQVQQTIRQLRRHGQDLDTSYNRRQVEVEQARQDYQRQDQELREAGKALEYYQELRLELASWVGALRELRGRVSPLQDALRQLQQEHLDRWEWWENGIVNTLRQADLLETIVGRQPPEETDKNGGMGAAKVLDEFGRDVKSQHVLEMEKHGRQRRLIQAERSLAGDESDAHLSNAERTEMKERQTALDSALEVAMEELAEQYSSLPDLVALFVGWHKAYPDEYKQCYAGMSLADLASVLMQVRLCTTHHPLHWQGATDKLLEKSNVATSTTTTPNDSGIPGTAALASMPRVEKDMEDTPVYRMIDKVLIPAMEDVLGQKAMNLQSTRHCHSMARFYQHTVELIPNPHTSVLVDKLNRQLVQYLSEKLNGIAIPILKSNVSVGNSTDDDDMSAVRDAVRYAQSGQLRRLEKMLQNLLRYFAPVLGKLLAEPVLDFVSSQLLYLLSSLPDTAVQEKKRVFVAVWESLQPLGWLEQSEYLLQSAPIRAASMVYCNKTDE